MSFDDFIRSSGWILPIASVIAAAFSSFTAWAAFQAKNTARRAFLEFEVAFDERFEEKVLREAENEHGGMVKKEEGYFVNLGPAAAAGVELLTIATPESGETKHRMRSVFFGKCEVGDIKNEKFVWPFEEILEIHLLWFDSRGKFQKAVYCKSGGKSQFEARVPRDLRALKWPPRLQTTEYLRDVLRADGQDPDVLKSLSSKQNSSI